MSTGTTELDDRGDMRGPTGQGCINISAYYLANQLNNRLLPYYGLFSTSFIVGREREVSGFGRETSRCLFFGTETA